MTEVGSPPRVALFDAYPHLLGGAQRTLLTLAATLAERGAAPSIVVPGDGALTAAARELALPVEVVTLPAPLRRFGRSTTGARAVAAAASLPVAWARLRTAFARTGAELVHANDHRGALLAVPAARAARLPVVWHVHSVDVDGRFVERFAGRLVSAVLAPSAAALRGVDALPPSKPRTVVGAAIDPAVAKVGPARGEGTGRIVLAARLHPAKGVDVAIRAIAELVGRGRSPRLDIYGAPQAGAEGYADEVHALPGVLGVGDHVRFHDHVEEMHEHWLTADVYVQPSRAETFGMAAAEAMALGLAVVAAAVGGVPELVEHGRTGLLVQPDDPVALADAIEELLDDPERAASLGAAAARRAAELTPDRLTDAVVDVWRHALDA